MATLPKSIELAWSNTYALTLGKNYKVHIWKDSITLEQNRVNGFYDNNVWKPSPPENRRRKNGETSFEVKLAKIERSESNIVALERCKTLDDIFNVFGYQEAKNDPSRQTRCLCYQNIWPYKLARKRR